MKNLNETIVMHMFTDGWWMDLISLKCLPLRSKNSHHDMHHKYSKSTSGKFASFMDVSTFCKQLNSFMRYVYTAKNYAEMFVIWDYVFGTLRNTPKDD
jgi:sterol desaturase/sphingolipid hydroxylase (fatty acid hydroxylase superfamily)